MSWPSSTRYLASLSINLLCKMGTLENLTERVLVGMKWDDLLICPFIPLVFLSPEKRVWGKMWWSSTPRWAHHGQSRLGKMLRCWCPQTQGWPLQGSVAALIGTGTWSRGRWWGQWNSYLPVLTSCPALCIFCCCSVAKACLALCNPMDCSMPGFPIFHYLLECAQIHVYWISDAISNERIPSHPLSSPSPPAFNFSQHQSFFQ